MMATPDPLYVAARRVLLDALDALSVHRRAVPQTVTNATGV